MDERKRIEVERVPVVQEQARVSTERVETGRVRVHVVPQVHQETIDVDLTDERVEVERVPVGRIVERAEASRQEGDVTIVPVYEEVLICEKRLRLKEELHIRRISTVHHERREVDLRREDVEVVRSPEPGSQPASAIKDGSSS
jgi:stress response protein YsnF